MVQIQPKRKMPTWMHAPWALLLLFVVSCALFWNVIVMAIKSSETRAKRQQAEEKHVELSSQKASLETALNALDTPKGTEAVLRDHLRVAKEGEELIVIVDSDTSREVEQKTGVLGFFQRLFGKKGE